MQGHARCAGACRRAGWRQGVEAGGGGRGWRQGVEVAFLLCCEEMEMERERERERESSAVSVVGLRVGSGLGDG